MHNTVEGFEIGAVELKGRSAGFVVMTPFFC